MRKTTLNLIGFNVVKGEKVVLKSTKGKWIRLHIQNHCVSCALDYVKS